MKKLEIYHLSDSLYTIKENQTEVNYFLFDEYEIHLNKIPAHTIQEWHYHRQIEEVILITKGNLQCMWLENNKKHIQTVCEKEIVLVKQSIHSFMNDSDEDCEFIVFRLVLEGISKRNVIKDDKVIIKNIEEY